MRVKMLSAALVAAGLAAWLIKAPSPALPQATDHPLPPGSRRYEPQRIPAVEQIRLYVDAFHLHEADGRPFEGRHYLSQIGEGLWQGVIVDRHDAQGRIVGVEYLISEERYRALPEEDKRRWHSHAHAVTSGQWVMPKADPEVERTVMRDLVKTYGRAWLCWDGDGLPSGSPTPLISPTKDGQVPAEMLRARDARVGVSTDEKRREREALRESVNEAR